MLVLMSTDTGSKEAPADEEELVDFMRRLDIEQEPVTGGALVGSSGGDRPARTIEADSTDFRAVVDNLDRIDSGTVEKMLYHFRGYSGGTDYAVFLPDEVSDRVLGDDEFDLPFISAVEGRGVLLGRARDPAQLQGLLAGNNFDEVYDYIESEVFDEGMLLFVPGGQKGLEEAPWAGRRAYMLNHPYSVMSSMENVKQDAGEARGAEWLGPEARESEFEADGSRIVKTVEFYPGADYDRVKARDRTSGVKVYGDGEHIAMYDGFDLIGSRRERERIGDEPVFFEMEKEQE